MTRPFATIGFTMLFTLYLLNNSDNKAAKAVFIIALVAFCIFMIIKSTRKNGALPLAAATVAVCCVFSVFNVRLTEKKTLDYIDTMVKIFGVITDVPYSDNGRVYYTVKTEKINGFDNNQIIRISSAVDYNAEPLDFLEGSFKVYAIGSGDSDMADYYKAKGCFLGAYTYDYDSVTITEKTGFHPYYYVLKARQTIVSTVNTVLPNEYGSLLLGLLLGIKSEINPKTLNAFSLIGSYHLLAVSGLHTTVWISFIYALLKVLNIKRKKRAVISILFTVFFMALTGFNPPVVRAGTLMIFSFLGMLFKRQADSYNSIGLAITALLILNPFSALSVSLWLSVFASVGIILLSHKLAEKFNTEKIHNKAIKYIGDFLIQSVSVSVSAVLFTLPVTLIFFDRVSLFAPVANLLLIWVSSLAMLVSGFAVLIFLTGLKFVAMPLFFFAGFMAKFITKTAQFLSSLPSISISAKYPLLIIFTAVLLITAAALLLKKNHNKTHLRVVAVTLAVLFAAFCAFGMQTEKRTLKFTVVSVGNGSCVVISKNNSAALIGCGGNFFSSYNICDILSKEGVAKADFVFIPRENETEASALEYIGKKFDIVTLKKYESGKLTLWDDIEIVCENEYAYIKSESITMLVVFTPALNINSIENEYKKADFLVSRAALPKNFENGSFGKIILSSTKEKSAFEANKAEIYSTADGSITIEVKQNGRTKVKRTA